MELANNYNTTMTNYGYLIKKSEFTPDILEEIKDDLTVKPQLDNKYNTKVEEPFPVFQEGQIKMLLPRFYGLEHFGLPKEIKTKMEDTDRINLRFNGQLRDYQEEIISKCKKFLFKDDNLESLLPYGGGVIVVPPGKGKTCMGLYLAQLIGYKTLVIVHKTFLVNQWTERIHQYLPDAKIGIIQQDKIDIEGKDIVIGMLQSICLKDYEEDIFEGFPLVIFDEVHHLGAKVFSKALLKIQAPYTIGLSATPNRKDKLEKVFYWHLGPLMWEQHADIDTTVKINMYNFNTSIPNKLMKPVFNFRTKQLNMAKMITNITELEIRNNFIFKLITNDIFPQIPIKKNKLRAHRIRKNNILKSNIFENLMELSTEPFPAFRKLLILSNRIEHLKRIEALMISYDKRWKNLIGYYIGGMKEKKLKESESKPLILATFEMASEGLDIQDLDTLILATPKSSITQSIGRILRLQAHQRNYIPIVYDIVDNVSMFISQGKKRYSDYISKEYTIDWFNVSDTNINHVNNPFLILPTNNNVDQFIEAEDEFLEVEDE